MLLAGGRNKRVSKTFPFEEFMELCSSLGYAPMQAGGGAQWHEQVIDARTATKHFVHSWALVEQPALVVAECAIAQSVCP